MEFNTSFVSREEELLAFSDDGHFKININGKIICDDNNKECGEIFAKRYFISGLDVNDVSDLMDSEGADEYPVYELLRDHDTGGYVKQIEDYFSFGANHIMFINEIYIKPNFRRKGLGQDLINTLIRTFCTDDTITCLMSQPAQLNKRKEQSQDKDYSHFNKDKNKAEISLNKYYKNIGFLKINSSEDGDIFFKPPLLFGAL